MATLLYHCVICHNGRISVALGKLETHQVDIVLCALTDHTFSDFNGDVPNEMVQTAVVVREEEIAVQLMAHLKRPYAKLTRFGGTVNTAYFVIYLNEIVGVVRGKLNSSGLSLVVSGNGHK